MKNKPTRIIDKNTTVLTTPDLVASNFGVASSSIVKCKQRSNLKIIKKKSFIVIYYIPRLNISNTSKEVPHGSHCLKILENIVLSKHANIISFTDFKGHTFQSIPRLYLWSLSCRLKQKVFRHTGFQKSDFYKQNDKKS